MSLEPNVLPGLRLVLASNNAKKLKELQALLAPVGVSLVTQGSLGIGEAEEPHVTFVENALQKARHAAAASGLPAIADDSGLCVDALGGAPGVHSARYAEVEVGAGEREQQRLVQDAANNAQLLEALRGQSDRRAHFLCTLVAVRSADDPEPLVAMGRWQGVIRQSAQGAGGFGYDPLLDIPAFGCSVAELDAERKNAVSHRALAAAQMLTLMREVWHLG